MTNWTPARYSSAMLRRFRNDERGVAMVLFALLALVVGMRN